MDHVGGKGMSFLFQVLTPVVCINAPLVPSDMQSGVLYPIPHWLVIGQPKHREIYLLSSTKQEFSNFIDTE